MDLSRGRKPGQWWPVVGGNATCYCSKCGSPMILRGHSILPDGTVNPSVVCPHPVMTRSPDGNLEDAREPTLGCAKCGFHEHVRLVGWPEHLAALKRRIAEAPTAMLADGRECVALLPVGGE